MRLAIVSASSYEENGQVAPIPNAEIDVELFGRRLAEADAGFMVHAFDAKRGLAEGIEELVRAQGHVTSLVFYFWGYALVSPERGPTLLLDGPKLAAFNLARLRRRLAELCDEALIILDATLAEGSVGEPLEAVRAMGHALSSAGTTISSLVAVHSHQQQRWYGPPPFTGLLQMIADAHTGSDMPLTPEALFRAMQAEDVMFADIPAAGCFLADHDFVLVPGARPISAPPPSLALPRSTPPTTANVAPRLTPPLLSPPPAQALPLQSPAPSRLALPPLAPLPPLSAPPLSAPLRTAALLSEPKTAPQALPPAVVLGGAAPSLAPPLPFEGLRDAGEDDEVTAKHAARISHSAIRPRPDRTAARPTQPLVPSDGPSASPAAAASASATELEPPALPAADAAYYRRLYEASNRSGDADGAYRAALCLDALGEADINESLLASTHRPEGLQSVADILSYADWNDRLCAGVLEAETAALLRALGPAVVSVGYRHARRHRRNVELSEEFRQQLDKSTTTVAKTLLWTSRLLAVPTAELYVVPEVAGSLAIIPGADRPLLVCGRSLASGFSLPELTFLWARELTFARPDAAALAYFQGPTELSQLLLAALAVSSVVPMRSLDGDAKRLASLLKREVRGANLEALAAACSQIDPREVRPRARAYIRANEIIAGRAGLVASGHLDAALALSDRFPRGAETSPEERRADLFAFTVSQEFGQIRSTLRVTVG